MRFRVDSIVYLVGIFIFGLAYSQLKAMFSSSMWFVAAAIGYLLALSVIGQLAKRAVERSRGDT